ncbi:MAG: acylneuraminate cytidylyltransferase [Clostridiales bacterium]|jgi:N-acylneuraminate cytidylyltransferase|nr:acylneuraminate cytidylyltransferase [Clostridiales bacterium]
MGNVAFIPARGGSKSIPGKNIANMCGRPMIHWALSAAERCPEIDRVYVSTDNGAIREAALSFQSGKVRVVERDAALCGDDSPTDAAFVSFAREMEFSAAALIQPTSPLVTSADISRGMALMASGRDSCLSVVRQKRFMWEDRPEGAVPVNYAPADRPARQVFPGQLVENGAFYITTREALLRTGCRVSGRIGLVEMPPDTYVEVDEPADFTVAELLLSHRKPFAGRLARIKALLADCDGTLTDGGIYFANDGDFMKKFHAHDGMAALMLAEAGFVTGVVTGAESGIVARRAERLAFSEVWQGVSDKLAVTREIAARRGLSLDEIAFIGDDLNDYAAMRAVGFSACPCDAVPEIARIADYVCKSPGGYGAYRELADLLIDAKSFYTSPE